MPSLWPFRPILHPSAPRLSCSLGVRRPDPVRPIPVAVRRQRRAAAAAQRAVPGCRELQRTRGLRDDGVECVESRVPIADGRLRRADAIALEVCACGQ